MHLGSRGGGGGGEGAEVGLGGVRGGGRHIFIITSMKLSFAFKPEMRKII